MEFLAVIVAYILGLVTMIVFGKCKEGLTHREQRRLHHARKDLKEHTDKLDEALKKENTDV